MNATPGHLTDYNCDRCKNRGYSAELRDGYIVSVECPCMEIRRSIRRARESGLGDLLEKHTFAAFQTPENWQKRAKQLAQEYAADPDSWFVASGASGSLPLGPLVPARPTCVPRYAAGCSLTGELCAT